MKQKISFTLNILGGLILFIAFIFILLTISSYTERAKYGPGLFFADVEIFGFIAIVCFLAGILSLWIAKRIRRKL